MADKAKPWRIDISGRRRLLDAFFKIDEVTVSHQQFDGEMSPERAFLVFERGDAVAALLHDEERRKIIVVNQFRLPTLNKGHNGGGWLIEAVAGMIRGDAEGKPAETPLECLTREVLEETGYQITEATPISTFFSSPGGSTEMIYLYYASVRRTERIKEGGGVKEDGEDIEIVEIDLDVFFDRLTAREFEDPKLIIAGQWLMARRASSRAEYDPDNSKTYKYKLKGSKDVIVGIKTGDIAATRGCDVWVNSENTDMMMDRFFGRSVSATIRFLGAQRHSNGQDVEKDTIGRALLDALGDRSYVAPASVIETTSGSLANAPYYVKRIFHVAAVQGRMGQGKSGQGLTATLKTLAQCMDNVLAEIAAKKYRSVLVPMLATGQGGHPVQDVAPVLVERALAFLKSRPKSPLKEIYFLAYSVGDKEDLQRELANSKVLESLPQE